MQKRVPRYDLFIALDEDGDGRLGWTEPSEKQNQSNETIVKLSYLGL